jgi:phosphatidate phosphatase LPIN
MTYIVDQLFPPIKLTDDDDCIEYTSFNYWRDPVCDVELDVSRGSSASPTSDSPNSSLNNIQSKPLATIPEN